MVEDSCCPSMGNRSHLCAFLLRWFYCRSSIMVDEDKTEDKTEEEPATEDSGDGDKSETTELIEQQNKRIKELETEKQQRAIEDGKKQLSGRAEAGTVPEKPKKLTDTEYAEALERGEVNPLKEDGLI